MNKFNLATPNGVIDLSGMITPRDFKPEDMDDSVEFMKKFVVNFNFSLPKPVLSYLFLMQMKYYLTAGNAQMDQQSSESLVKLVNILLDSQLNTWVKKGYLTQDANIIASKLVFESGEVSLNGVKTQ